MGFAQHFFLQKPPGGEYHLISWDWGTNQITQNALFTCVVYTNREHCCKLDFQNLQMLNIIDYQYVTLHKFCVPSFSRSSWLYRWVTQELSKKGGNVCNEKLTACWVCALCITCPRHAGFEVAGASCLISFPKTSEITRMSANCACHSKSERLVILFIAMGVCTVIRVYFLMLGRVHSR